MHIGDIVEAKVISIKAYGIWAVESENIIFIHLWDLSKIKPIPPEAIPALGDIIEVELSTQFLQDDIVPPDISYGDTFLVSFTGFVP